MIAKILKGFAGILLLPVVIGMGMVFYEFVMNISPESGVLRVFEHGILAYLLFHVLIARPVYVYVFGHEFVHVLATWLSGGHVTSFEVTPGEGGRVVTSKTNLFIELSPYFIPIYTVLLGPIFLMLKAFGVDISVTSDIFVFLLGLTLAFHFIMTAEILRVKQTDIEKTGFILAAIPIFVGNMIVVMAVLALFFNNLSFMSFMQESFTGIADIYRMIYDKCAELLSGTSIF